MRTLFKKSTVIFVLAVMMISAFVAGILITNPNTYKVSAISVQDGVATEGFEMTEGSFVRKSDGTLEAGQKWETNVSDDFETYLTGLDGYQSHEYRTLVTSVNMLPENGTILDVTPDLTKADGVSLACQDMKGTLISNKFYGSILYGGENWDSYENKPAIYATELIARAYVKVVKTDGSQEIIYAKSPDVSRSMRAVAAEALLKNVTGVEQYVGDITPDAHNFISYYDYKDSANTIDVTGVADGDYTAYLNANKIGTVTVASGSVKIDSLSTLAKGKTEYHLNLFEENGFTDVSDIYSVDFVNPTAIITTPAELQTNLNLNNTDYKNVRAKNEIGVIDGYYVLGNDIDCSETELAAQGIMYSSIGGDTYAYLSTTEMSVGFIGTFDGRGHTISNVTFNSNDINGNAPDGVRTTAYIGWNNLNMSLFGTIGKDAVVKNFAMTNVKYNIGSGTNNGATETCNAARCAAIASTILDNATLENIYIDTYGVTKGGAVGATYVGGVAFSIYPTAKLHNVISDFTLGSDTTAIDMSYAISNHHYGTTYEYNIAEENLSNVYIISDKPAMGCGAATVYFDATNVEKREGETRVLANSYRYESVDAWMADSERNYADFETTNCWKMIDGLPVFNGLQLSKAIGYELCLDNTKTALTADDKKNIAGSAEILDIQSLSSTYTITYNGGDISVAKTAGGALTYDGTVLIPIAIKTEKYLINTSIRLVTKVITTAEDLAIFNVGNTNTSYTAEGDIKTITGYYVLGNDIDFNDTPNYELPTHGYIKNENSVTGTTNNSAKGFQGTFDGRGYTIKNVVFTSGNPTGDRTYWNAMNLSLFGIVGKNAVVKNFAMTNVSYKLLNGTNTASNNAAQGIYMSTCSPLGAFICSGAQVENVYVETGSITGAAEDFTNWAGLANRIENGATIKNVVVDATNITGYTNSGSLAGGHMGANSATTIASVEDVYVISATKLIYWPNDKYHDAAYIDGVVNETTTPPQVSGSYRYTDATAFKSAAATDNFASFTDTGYWSWDATNGLAWTGNN